MDEFVLTKSECYTHLPNINKLQYCINLRTFIILGKNGGGRFVPGLSGWQEASQAIRNNFRRKTRQTQQRAYEGAQSRKCQQKFSISSHKGMKTLIYHFDIIIIILFKIIYL